MKKMFMAVIAMMMTLSASAQFYIYYSDGTVAKVDSISMVAPDYNGHEYVDLGLSVKWATCNVGATKPEEFGHYFAWGEIEPKDTVTVDNYKWMTSYDSYTKYCINSDLGNVDNKTILEAEDDAATVYWGEQWRMPTYEECVELVEKCTWTWTTQNEVEGYLVVGPNGNSIFLPSAGLRIMETHFPIRVSYWSSSLYTSDENTYSQTRCARALDCRKNLQPRVAQYDREVTSIPIRAVQP